MTTPPSPASVRTHSTATPTRLGRRLLPPALRKGWRYSHLSTRSVLTGLGSLAILLGVVITETGFVRLITGILAALLGIGLLGTLLVGAIRAGRAHRYGCW